MSCFVVGSSINYRIKTSFKMTQCIDFVCNSLYSIYSSILLYFAVTVLAVFPFAFLASACTVLPSPGEGGSRATVQGVSCLLLYNC